MTEYVWTKHRYRERGGTIWFLAPKQTFSPVLWPANSIANVTHRGSVFVPGVGNLPCAEQRNESYRGSYNYDGSCDTCHAGTALGARRKIMEVLRYRWKDGDCFAVPVEEKGEST